MRPAPQRLNPLFPFDSGKIKASNIRYKRSQLTQCRYRLFSRVLPHLRKAATDHNNRINIAPFIVRWFRHPEHPFSLYPKPVQDHPNPYQGPHTTTNATKTTHTTSHKNNNPPQHNEQSSAERKWLLPRSYRPFGCHNTHYRALM